MKPILHSIPTIQADDIEAVTSQLKSGHLEDGETVKKFEHAFANYIGRKYAVSTANGYGAIHLSLIALGISENDEVIIPSYTCSALLNPIKLLSGTPVIVDIEANGFNLSPETIQQKLSPRTKAIILPHTFGFPAGQIESIINMGIPVIEDCAQSTGGSLRDKRLGSFGEISIFSFYSTKMLCAGDGGMILTDNKQLYDIACRYRYYGGEADKTETALNYRFTNLFASLGLSQLGKLDSFITRRKEIAARYDSYFKDHPQINIDFKNKEDSCFYRYPVQLARRDIVKQKLQQKGIHAGFGVLENMYKLMKLPGSNYPNATKMRNHILSIPIYPSLTDDQVAYISETLIQTVEE